MDEPAKIEVTLSFEKGTTEKLLITHVGSNLYRLESTPVSGDVNYLDVAEALPGANNILEVVVVRQPSPLRRYDLLLSKWFSESGQLQAFLEQVKTAGGAWERMWGGKLVIYLPPGSPLDPAKEMARIAEEL